MARLVRNVGKRRGGGLENATFFEFYFLVLLVNRALAARLRVGTPPTATRRGRARIRRTYYVSIITEREGERVRERERRAQREFDVGGRLAKSIAILSHPTLAAHRRARCGALCDGLCDTHTNTRIVWLCSLVSHERMLLWSISIHSISGLRTHR